MKNSYPISFLKYFLIMSKKQPLVSCLCVSSNRPEFLKNTIKYFEAQTYPNKELIIVSNHFSQEYKEIVDSINSSDIKYYFLSNDRKVTLGELRNYSIKMSGGEYFCIWDDDDWYHRNRLKIQLQEAVRNNKPATIMPYFILFNKVKRQGALSHLYPIQGSILCRKKIITEGLKYPSMNISEDRNFAEKLYECNAFFPVINPSLYIYIYHGTNTWNEGHFDFFYERGYKLSPELNQIIEDIITNKYNYEKSSELLDSPDVLKEFNYFYQR